MNDKFIALSVPNLKGNELKYITEAVETEWVSTAGPYVTKFEESIANYVGVKRAVSCQSGTSGLHTALIVLGVQPGDMVIVPTLTFIAAVNPVVYMNAEPVFMDCDDSLCMDPVKLRRFCENECEKKLVDGTYMLFHRESNRRVFALVAVHIFGNMADMEAIMSIAEEFHIKVLEDATEAIGTYYTEGKYKGMYAGTIGDAGVYSFNGHKIITTGGGGMIVSKNEELLEHAKHLTTQAKADEANFIHDEIGFNYRMTNLQAAMGLAQLEQLEKFIDIKIKNYNLYKEAFGDSIISFRRDIRSNHWFYSLFVDEKFTVSQREMIDRLKSQRIQTRPIWGLIHEQKPYENSKSYDIAVAKEYWKHIVNLPCSTNLTSEDVQRVISEIQEMCM